MNDAFVSCFILDASQWQEVVSSTSFGVSNSDSASKIGPKILFFWTKSIRKVWIWNTHVNNKSLQKWFKFGMWFDSLAASGGWQIHQGLMVQVESFTPDFRRQTTNEIEVQSIRMIRLTWWCSSGKQPHENLKAGTEEFWWWEFSFWFIHNWTAS